jgi:hypothetical protein
MNNPVYLFRFSTCFDQLCAHHQESQLYQYNIWYMSLCVGDRPVCRSGRNLKISFTGNHPDQRSSALRLLHGARRKLLHPDAQQPARESVNSPPYNAEVMNAWSYASIPGLSV